MYGYKGYSDGVIVIKVDGFPRERFFFYSMREAEKKYRESHGLKHKKITWY